MVGMLHDVDTSTTPPVAGNVLVNNGSLWVPGSAAKPIWKHDALTVASPPVAGYTATYLPTTGSLMLAQKVAGAVGGDLLIEGTDYTVDYTTGDITMLASQTAGDKLIARYESLGALSSSVYRARDDFNRADSGTTLNTASDGGTWSVNTPTGHSTTVYGVKSNQAFAVNNVGPGAFAYRDTGQVATDERVNIFYTGFQRTEYYFAFDPVGFTSYFIDSNSQLFRVSGNTPGDWTGGTAIGTPFSASVGSSGDTTRIFYDPDTGDIELFINGASQGVKNDSSPLTGAGNTCVGFGTTQTYYVGGGTSGTVNTGETWDNFKAVTV